MKWKILVPALVLSLMTPAVSQAVDWAKIFRVNWCQPACPIPTCCDDYCPKPLPCTRPVCQFQCDDYCPKCEPCVRKICQFCCDDYCYKCPPVVPCPPCRDLKCVPLSTCGCGGTTHHACPSACGERSDCHE